MVHSISILGSTGSIGCQTVHAALRLGLPVKALAADKNIDLLEQQARQLKPELVSASNTAAAAELRRRLSDTPVRVLEGEQGLIEAALVPDCDCVVTGVSGSVGLKPTLAAIRAGRRIALANKETLVCAGTLVLAEAERCGAEIIPVDSEHSAIFQCLTGRNPGELKTIHLTCSGGPFRGKTLSEMKNITPEMALNHPNWNMGPKITIDSATLMNKGLEYIEAMRLFHVKPEEVHVLVHPESKIHSMVELLDGTVIAQLGIADMELPIQYALTYPERRPTGTPALDFAACGCMHFHEPDLENFPCLRLAMDCARMGGSAPAVLSAANESAVAAFLRHRVAFTDIYSLVAAAVEELAQPGSLTLEGILEIDGLARRTVERRIGE